MQMKKFKEMRFISLLSEASQSTTNEMENAYEDFREWLIEVLNYNDSNAAYWQLNEARVELSSLDSIIHGQKKKCTRKGLY